MSKWMNRQLRFHAREVNIENRELRSHLVELIVLMESVREGNYKPDSLTVGPAMSMLRGSERKQVNRRLDRPLDD